MGTAGTCATAAHSSPEPGVLRWQSSSPIPPRPKLRRSRLHATSNEATRKKSMGQLKEDGSLQQPLASAALNRLCSGRTIRPVSLALVFTSLMGASISSLACSPPSDPTRRHDFFERRKGIYRFWGVVVGEEPVRIEAQPWRPAKTLTGLRVRIIDSHIPALPESKEFTFLAAGTDGSCSPDYGSLSTNEYPVGTEVHLGSNDLPRVTVLGVSRKAALQCPDAIPVQHSKPTNHGETESLAMPKVIPAGYSGCQYTWFRYVGSRTPMETYSTRYFVDGRLQWIRNREHLCIYEAGVLNTGKSFGARYCPASEALALRVRD